MSQLPCESLRRCAAQLLFCHGSITLLKQPKKKGFTAYKLHSTAAVFVSLVFLPRNCSHDQKKSIRTATTGDSVSWQDRSARSTLAPALRISRKPRQLRERSRCGTRDGLAGDELEGALARDEVVVHNAADGEHSKPAVLDLRELETANPNSCQLLDLHKNIALR
jgi:hypothetical protein